MKGPSHKNPVMKCMEVFLMISYLRNFPVFSNRYRDPPNPWKITCKKNNNFTVLSGSITPPKFNIEAENDGLEDEFPFPGGPYSQVPW